MNPWQVGKPPNTRNFNMTEYHFEKYYDVRKCFGCIVYFYTYKKFTSKFCSIECYCKSDMNRNNGRIVGKYPKDVNHIPRVKMLSKKPKTEKQLNAHRKAGKLMASIYKKELHSKWKGGITHIGQQIRNLPEYRQWWISCFTRDNKMCQKCSEKRWLEVHHKVEFSEILSNFLRKYSQFSPIEDKETLARLATTYLEFWDVNNGETLCKQCHKSEHIERIQK